MCSQHGALVSALTLKSTPLPAPSEQHRKTNSHNSWVSATDVDSSLQNHVLFQCTHCLVSCVLIFMITFALSLYMQEFLPTFHNKSCTIIHLKLCSVLLYSIPDTGTYHVPHTFPFWASWQHPSSCFLPFFRWESISLCNVGKHGLRSETRSPVPLKGTAIYISRQAEMNLGLSTSQTCTWAFFLTMGRTASCVCR